MSNTRTTNTGWAIWAVALLLMLICGLGIVIWFTASAQDANDFATICHALGGTVYGRAHDVCVDGTGHVILMDTGARR